MYGNSAKKFANSIVIQMVRGLCAHRSRVFVHGRQLSSAFSLLFGCCCWSLLCMKGRIDCAFTVFLSRWMDYVWAEWRITRSLTVSVIYTTTDLHTWYIHESQVLKLVAAGEFLQQANRLSRERLLSSVGGIDLHADSNDVHPVTCCEPQYWVKYGNYTWQVTETWSMLFGCQGALSAWSRKYEFFSLLKSVEWWPN